LVTETDTPNAPGVAVDVSPDKLTDKPSTAVFRVKSSRQALPRPEYTARGGPNVPQWQIEWEPLSFKYDDGGLDFRAVNLFSNEDNYQRYLQEPDADLMVGKRSPLYALGKAFEAAGSPVTNNLTVIEGLIFRCELLQIVNGVERKERPKNDKERKEGKYLQLPRELLAEYTPPADIRTIKHFGRNEDTAGATPLSDSAGAVSTLTEEQATDIAVEALNGKPMGEDLTTLSSLPDLMQEPWMSKVIGGEMLQLCYKAGKLALIDGVLRKIER